MSAYAPVYCLTLLVEVSRTPGLEEVCRVIDALRR